MCIRDRRKVMDIAFAEGNRLGVPVILETDAKSKCDKYVHLGMELAGVRDIGEFGKLYDLIKDVYKRQLIVSVCFIRFTTEDCTPSNSPTSFSIFAEQFGQSKPFNK